MWRKLSNYFISVKFKSQTHCIFWKIIKLCLQTVCLKCHILYMVQITKFMELPYLPIFFGLKRPIDEPTLTLMHALRGCSTREWTATRSVTRHGRQNRTAREIANNHNRSATLRDGNSAEDANGGKRNSERPSPERGSSFRASIRPRE